MEVDLFAQLLTSPVGISIVAFAFLVISLPWRLILASEFTAVGWRPLVAGYVGAAAGSWLLAALSVSFSGTGQMGLWERGISSGLIDLGKLSAVFMIMSVPVLGVMVLVSSWRLRCRRFTWHSILLISLAAWAVISALFSLLPSNEWSRLHMMESMLIRLVEVLSFIMFVVLPFLSIIRVVVGRRTDA